MGESRNSGGPPMATTETGECVTVFGRNNENRRRAVTVARSINSGRLMCCSAESCAAVCFLSPVLAPLSIHLRYTRHDRTRTPDDLNTVRLVYGMCAAHHERYSNVSFVQITAARHRSHNRFSPLSGAAHNSRCVSVLIGSARIDA